MSLSLICHACRAWYHESEFHRDRTRVDRNGRHVHCKPCRRDIRIGYPSHARAVQYPWPEERAAARQRLAEARSQTFRVQSWLWFRGWVGDGWLRSGIPESERAA